MATSPNFSWPEPDNTDLVRNGALAIRTAVDAIDSSLVDLKGGTTGQVLAKATNTDMDFTWVAQDDSNAIQNAIVDAKGDLIAATANDTPARLAVGTNGQVLTADSTAATGLKWATAAGGGGKVLQVVSATTTTAVTNSTTTFTDTNLTATITPTLSTSKILVLVTQLAEANRSGADTGLTIRVRRDSTTIFEPTRPTFYVGDVSANIVVVNQVNISFLDSPATTSATTYKTQVAALGAGTAKVQNASNPSSIILLEIGA
jgi:hypothetical protein